MAAPAEPIIRALGLILSNATVYGPAHTVTRNAAADCYRTLQLAWLDDDVRMTLADDELSVNRVPVDLKNRLARHLADHLAAREISDVTLLRGMTEAQFLAFVEVLQATPEELQQLDGFTRAIESVGLGAAVACHKRVYREITEDQEVVDRGRLATLGRADGSSGDGEGASGGNAAAAGTEAESTASLLAWLKGVDDNAAPGRAAQAVRDICDDPSRLAAIILDSAEARVAAGDAPTGLGEAMVDSLRQAYTAMTADPAFHTQKTKKQIQRTLGLLEQELAGRLTALDLPGDDSVDVLKEAVEEMSDELTVDALAQAYARKRSAIETSERRLIRYVKRKGLDGIEDSDLKQRLIESGLDENGWRELLARCMPAPGGGGAAGTVAHTTPVTDVVAEHLRRLVTDAASSQPDAPPVSEAMLKRDLEPVREAVEAVVRSALQRIENLVAEVEGPDGGPEAGGATVAPRLTRKRLFEILAELGQELCQPLAVMTCAVDMIRDGGLGDVTELQVEMLNTAAESGDKLKTLIDRVIAIAGMPSEDAVNKEIQASLYT